MWVHLVGGPGRLNFRFEPHNLDHDFVINKYLEKLIDWVFRSIHLIDVVNVQKVLYNF